MFDETGCVPGIDGEQVPAERIVPDAKEYISETIDDPETMYDPEIWNTPGFALVLSWLAQKWNRRPGADRAPPTAGDQEMASQGDERQRIDSA